MRFTTTLILVSFLAVPLAPASAGTPSPDDWRDQSIYQIMTDRFFDGDPSNNTVEGNYDPSDGYKIHGGDWAGIEQKLDYIAGLGATALWISPVQKNAYGSYHGYSIQDFYDVAPHFGGMPDLHSLVGALHDREMYILLDVIANHGADLIDSGDPGYPDFHNPGDYTLRWKNDQLRHAPPFDDLSMFHNNGHIIDYNDPEQILGELFALDDFRTEEEAVRDALIEAHQWLIDTVDADGFRIDTVKHAELSFWQEWGPAITSYTDSIGKTDFFQFGEVFDGSSWKNGLYTGTQAGGPFALESTLWYPMFFTANWVFRDGGSTEALSSVYGDSTCYDPTARNRLVIFLDNHDNARFMGFGSNAAQDDAKARVALTWMHTSLGVPCVYYGYEQEFDGGGDPWDREDMWDGEWDFGPSVGGNFDQSAPLYRHLRELNGLRRRFPALRRGAQETIASGSGPGLYAYYRKMAGEETVLVLLNTKGEAESFSIDPDLPAGAAWDLLTGDTLTVPGSGAVEFVVGGLSAKLIASAPPATAPWIERTRPAHDGTLTAVGGRIEIDFNQTMDHGSVESSIEAVPSFVYTARWRGNTLMLLPAPDFDDQTVYTLRIGGGARAESGDSLGASFTFFFRTDDGSSPVTIPDGYHASTSTDYDLKTPISLEPGREWGELLFGDTGWDRIFRWNDRGMVEAAVVDSLVGRPNAIALDEPDGLYGGDLLIADQTRLLRVDGDGARAGDVSVLADWPGPVYTWAVVIDGSGDFGRLAYIGAPGIDSVYSVDPAGTVTPFAGINGGVTGLAFSEGEAFGRYLYATDGSERIVRIDPAGAVETFAADTVFLEGATSPLFDGTGDFGGDLYVVNELSQQIVRVGPAGAVSTFASGFTSLLGIDVLAFHSAGDLYALETGFTGSPRLVRIWGTPSDTAVPGDTLPPPPHRFLLGRNAPNPFNPETKISFELPRAGRARLTIHDLRGRLVRVLFDEERREGPRQEVWNGTGGDGRDAPSGVYFYRLRFETTEETRRMVLLR